MKNQTVDQYPQKKVCQCSGCSVLKRLGHLWGFRWRLGHSAVELQSRPCSAAALVVVALVAGDQVETK